MSNTTVPKSQTGGKRPTVSLRIGDMISRDFVAEFADYTLLEGEKRTVHVGHRPFPRVVSRSIEHLGRLVNPARYFGDAAAFCVQAGSALLLTIDEIDVRRECEDAVGNLGALAADEKLWFE